MPQPARQVQDPWAISAARHVQQHLNLSTSVEIDAEIGDFMWKKCCKKDPPLQPSLEAWGRFLQAFQSFEGQHTARQHVKATRHARRTWLIVDLNQLLRPESDEMNITAIKTKRITSSAIEKRTGQSVPKGPKKFPHEPQNTVLQHQARRPSTVQKTGPVSLRVVAHQAPGCLWCDIAFRN